MCVCVCFHNLEFKNAWLVDMKRKKIKEKFAEQNSENKNSNKNKMIIIIIIIKTASRSESTSMYLK